MVKNKNENVIIKEAGPELSKVKIQKRFDWKEFLSVDWKDKWNIMLLLIALAILYFSIKAIIAAMSKGP